MLEQTKTILTNANIVLRDQVILGTLTIEHGVIVDVTNEISNAENAINCHGDFILPGLIELHTDHMEKYFSPRPNAEWPERSAMMAFDGICVSSGITTVLDAITIGYICDGGTRLNNLSRMIKAVTNAKAYRCRVDHMLHLRCEVANEVTVKLFDELFNPEIVKLVSIMDHSPGQRQYTSIEQYRIYYQGKFGWSDEVMAEFEREQSERARLYSAKNRRIIVDKCNALGIPLASHDDALEAHVIESKTDQMAVAEFPTTFEAAKKSHELGLKVLMGAPNVVRGGSHSGNIAAADLAKRGELDILSSDYYPASLLQAAFMLAEMDNPYDLPAAIALVTANPAEALGLQDRGIISKGKLADLVRVELNDCFPMVKQVFKNGRAIY